MQPRARKSRTPRRIAPRFGVVDASMMVGVLLLTTLACNVSMLAYPIWFYVPTSPAAKARARHSRAS